MSRKRSSQPLETSFRYGHRRFDRRRFLASGLAGAAGLLLPEHLLSDVYRAPSRPRSSTKPVRIRGVVRQRNNDLAISGVSISDGYEVVQTAADGTFELISSDLREFLSMTVPAGYRVPQSATGTASFYQPMPLDNRGEARIAFELEPLRTDDERHALLLLGDIQSKDAEEMRWFHERSVPDVQNTLQELGEIETLGVGQPGALPRVRTRGGTDSSSVLPGGRQPRPRFGWTHGRRLHRRHDADDSMRCRHADPR